jgi:putative ABC transport system ATP-binding protein
MSLAPSLAAPIVELPQELDEPRAAGHQSRAPASPMVELRRVSKVYQLGPTAVTGLRKVQLAINAGDFVAILGPSGSGKTTLLNLIACLDVPTEGEVLLAGRSVMALSPAALAKLRSRMIGIVFQTFNLIPVLSVYENVEYPLLLLGVPPRERREQVWYFLTAVGLKDRAQHRPEELSGGQRQRVGIARALITRPALVIADEPTASLDRQTAQAIIDLMRRINREERVTFLFSTHDLNLIKSADRFLRLEDGELCS